MRGGRALGTWAAQHAAPARHVKPARGQACGTPRSTKVACDERPRGVASRGTRSTRRTPMHAARTGQPAGRAGGAPLHAVQEPPQSLPVSSPLRLPSAQSGHFAEQEPPQSTPVSSPFFTPSEQPFDGQDRHINGQRALVVLTTVGCVVALGPLSLQ